MNTVTEIAAALPAEAPARQDGWTPERQRAFIEAIAEGHTVSDACRSVGMTKQSAYAFKKRAAGAAFALGWSAANLLARDTLADALLVRALEGQVETCTRPDGATWTRHRHDNRLATTMLARLDRQVETAPGAEAEAARLIAREFEAFLDLIDRDAGPARAGLFLAARTADDADPDLDPITALARADRWLKARAGTALELDVHDLDPGQRASWTAEQWARAEAIGLIAVAPEADTRGSSQFGQLRPGEDEPEAEDFDDDDDDDGLMDGRVWWQEDWGCWRTDFPPPADFDGDEIGRYGENGYERDVTPQEAAAADARHAAELAEARALEEAARDRWFGAFAPASDDARGHRGDRSTDVEQDEQSQQRGIHPSPPHEDHHEIEQQRATEAERFDGQYGGADDGRRGRVGIDPRDDGSCDGQR
jgi:hypothetical protein